MPTRTLPTRDVTLADGRRLYYQQEESRRCAEAGKATAVYMTKRGPDGALHILITWTTSPSAASTTTSPAATPRARRHPTR